MILVGLTGGIGAGKSTVAGMFSTLGIPVFNSDERAKKLMHEDVSLKSKISAVFGTHAYDKYELDKKWIADQVFNDPAKLEQLNKIVHPAVFEDLMEWTRENEQSNAPYLIQESAILFEEDLISRFHAIILVVANTEERITRVMKRDNASREKVIQRLANQWDDEKKITKSDFVIYNDVNHSLIAQVTDIDKMIRSKFIDA